MYHLCFVSQLKELWIHKNDKYIPVHELLQLLAGKSGYIIIAEIRRVHTHVCIWQTRKNSLVVTDSIVQEAQNFVSALFVCEGSSNLNTLRQHMFGGSKADQETLTNRSCILLACSSDSLPTNSTQASTLV